MVARRPRVPRVTTGKVSTVLVLSALGGKALVSVLVGDTVGSWVGGALGFASTVTFTMYQWHLAHPEKGAPAGEVDADR